MKKRIAGLLVIVFAAMLVPAALPQMEPTPVVYTYVSQFQVPRAHWAAYSEDTEKTVVPIVEKLTAEGTILSWSTFEQVIHTADGYTHGAAWSSTSVSGLMKGLDEIRKGGPPTYLRVVCSSAKADKPGEYAATLKKLLVPTFEEQVKKGVATYYSVDEQYVNTAPPSTRCVVINYPNAESMDKWAAAINTTMSKWSPAERAEFAGSTVADSRRDFMARITHSGHK